MTIILYSCIIKTDDDYGIDYHTNSCVQAQHPVIAPAKVTVKNCYFVNCSFSYTALDADTGVERDLCVSTNNSVNAPILHKGTSLAIKYIEWNNEIRSN